MSKESLEKLNQSLLKHFEETNVKNAYYYTPVAPAYWEKTTGSKHVAFCNLEPYKKDKNVNTKGCIPLNKDILYDSWFYRSTPSRIFAMNYYLTQALYDGKEDILEEEISCAVSKRKRTKELEEALWVDFDNSLYFNFRYTYSNKVSADTTYIRNMYKEPFIANFIEILLKKLKLIY